MKNLKRNQIIVFVIALMLVSAGYLNFTANNINDTVATSTNLNVLQEASIGDAKLVSSNGIIETSEEEALVPNDDIETNAEEISDTNEIIMANSKETDEYFTSSRLTRETMYSQMLETYEKILSNENISSEQKKVAQDEIKNINDTKNRIMICENLIQTKGVEDLVIFVNGNSVSVIIKADKLEQDLIAQIQNIVSRELGADVENIHISNK